MEHAPGVNNETPKGIILSPEEIARNEKLLEAKNKMQLALALAILQNGEETKEIFSNIHDESDLMTPPPEVEEYVFLTLEKIRDDVRKMCIEHPEVIEHIAVTETNKPLDEIDLSEAKGYLPQHFEVVH